MGDQFSRNVDVVSAGANIVSMRSLFKGALEKEKEELGNPGEHGKQMFPITLENAFSLNASRLGHLLTGLVGTQPLESCKSRYNAFPDTSPEWTHPQTEVCKLMHPHPASVLPHI